MQSKRPPPQSVLLGHDPPGQARGACATIWRQAEDCIDAALCGSLPLIAGGQIEPARDRSFPLEQGPEALRHLIEDRPFGKVTLAVGDISK